MTDSVWNILPKFFIIIINQRYITKEKTEENESIGLFSSPDLSHAVLLFDPSRL